MTLKQIAKAFRLNVDEFAGLLGYSKQALYDITKAKTGINKGRFNSTLGYLEVLSKDMHKLDIDEANLQKLIRQRAIEELRKYGEEALAKMGEWEHG